MVDEIVSLSNAIKSNGVLTVAMAIFMLVVIIAVCRIDYIVKQFITTSMKQNDEYQQTITNQNSKIIDTLLDTKDEVENGSTKKDLFKTFTQLSIALKDNCKDLMTSISADRIAIYLFHDGAYSTHGIHFFKMSCICEKVLIGSGVRERSIEHSNLPINLFDEMIESLISNGEFIIQNTDELANSNRRIFISSNKIKYSQAISIFDNDNNIIGFVLAEMDKPYSEKECAESKKQILTFISQMVPVLTYSDYIKINTDINK